MNRDRQYIERDIEHITLLTMNTIIIFKCRMSYFRNYLNLEIVCDTALSDAQYLKSNLLLRAEICSSTVHMPKYLQISWYVSLERAQNILQRALLRANCKECLTAEFTGHASVP